MSDQNRIPIEVSAAGEFEIVGEIDAYSAEALADRVSEASEASRIVLDMSGVTFMDSSGLRVLLALAERGQSGGPTLTIARPSRPILRLLEISGLSDHFDIVHSDVA